MKSAALIPVLWALGVLAPIWARPLLPMDETRYLAVAWEMWQRGDFLVPYLNGEPYSHKPPLLFWGMHLGWAVFGVNEWWPRLVAPLFGLATVLLTRGLARRLWPDDANAGPAASFVCLGALYFTLFVTMTMFDMLLAACAVAGLIGLVDAWRGRRLHGFAVVAAAVGLGILAKGPAILVHVLPAALAAPWWAWRLDGGLAEPPRWRGWYGGIGLALLAGAAIGLAWAVPAGIAGGADYRNAIFWGQSAGRMVDSFAHGRPFWWFAAILPAMMLPWTVWPAAWRALRRGGRALVAGDGGLRLCLIWFGAAFLVFSAISGKQPHYLLPEFPALALILARAVSVAAGDGDSAGTGFWRTWDRWLPAAVSLLILAAVAAMFLFDLRPAWATSEGEAHVWPLAVAALVVLAGVGASAGGLSERVMAIAGMSVAVIIGLHLTLRPMMLESHDFGPLARQLKTFEDDGYDFITFGKYHGQFHFQGRLTRPFAVVDGPRALDAWLKDHPKAMIVSQFWDMPQGAAPDAMTVFRSRIIGVWRAEKYPPRRARLNQDKD